MSEKTANLEVAQHLHEKGEKPSKGMRENDRLELLEAFLLAIVAVATAWSGYQAARWDGNSAENYAKAAVYRVESNEDSVRAAQNRLNDLSTFNAWLQAKTTGDEPMRKLLERRFSEEYGLAFKAWLLTDPLNDPNAPPGPAYMPEYVDHLQLEGAAVKKRAEESFEAGRSAREIGEDYVRLTVFLATVLFLIAISQRFSNHVASKGLLGIAAIATAIILVLLFTYPRF